MGVRYALRGAVKNRLYAVINIGGLAVALMAALLIGIFLRHELSFDRQWPGVERTYRAVAEITVVGHATERTTNVHWPMTDLLANAVPDLVEGVARVAWSRQTAQLDGAAHHLNAAFVDPEFLRYFPPQALVGDGRPEALRGDGLILTEQAAKRLFGGVDALGRTLRFGAAEMVVTAIVADPPVTSHLALDGGADALIAFDSPLNFSREATGDWMSTPGQAYVRLRPGITADQVTYAMAGLLSAHRPARAAEVEAVTYGLQPVTSIHLGSTTYPEGALRGSQQTLIAYALVGAIILAVAAANFTNLGSALAFARAKEVGIRKVAGAGRGRLIRQFLAEAVAASLIAFGLAMAGAELALPWFGGLMGRPLSLGPGVMDPVILGAGVLLAVGVGILGAVLPAIRLSGLTPASALTGGATTLLSGGGLRSALILFQFATAIALIVATLVIQGQMHLLRQVDMGYHRDRLVILPDLPGATDARVQTLMSTLSTLPGVEAAARTLDIPTQVPERYFGVRRADGGAQTDVATFFVGAGALDAMQVRLVAGRLPDPARAGDELVPLGDQPMPRSAALILNESAVRHLGYVTPQAALNQTLIAGGGDAPITFTIIGVIADVRFGTAREAVKATIYPASTAGRTVILRLAPGASETALAEIRSAWARLLPDRPFQPRFVADMYGALYAADARQGATLAAFSGLAILIACLGLFGLAAFTAERRTKEIGIRKVLGATLRDIVQLLAWQFSKPVLLANLIAWPVAWVGMRHWLDGYLLRVDLHPGYFLLAGVTALSIAWITISAQAYRVARAAPINALRHE